MPNSLHKRPNQEFYKTHTSGHGKALKLIA
jgi:hypothetical protein